MSVKTKQIVEICYSCTSIKPKGFGEIYVIKQPFSRDCRVLKVERFSNQIEQRVGKIGTSTYRADKNVSMPVKTLTVSRAIRRSAGFTSQGRCYLAWFPVAMPPDLHSFEFWQKLFAFNGVFEYVGFFNGHLSTLAVLLDKYTSRLVGQRKRQYCIVQDHRAVGANDCVNKN